MQRACTIPNLYVRVASLDPLCSLLRVLGASQRVLGRQRIMADLEYGGDVAEPFRFNFEIAWEVANKGTCTCTLYCCDLTGAACDFTLHVYIFYMYVVYK